MLHDEDQVIDVYVLKIAKKAGGRLPLSVVKMNAGSTNGLVPFHFVVTIVNAG